MEIDEHDGVAVAPNNHKVIFENDQIRVLETTIAVGETTPLHTHHRPTLNYVLSGSHFIRRYENGEIMRDTRAETDSVQPKVHFVESRPMHTIENTDSKNLVVLGVELKG
jgi:mannose-6-phosphate isomerase-like protein (cupin superfamily)